MMTRATVLLLSLAVLPRAGAQSPVPAQAESTIAIKAEVTRMRERLSALKLPDAEQGNFNAVFQRSENAIQAGHLFLSLYLMQNVAPDIGGYELRQAARADGKAEFEQTWQALGRELTARQRRLTPLPRLPRVVQAIIERSLTQVLPNYQASLPYAQEAGVESGLYYLGLARGHQDFAAFCRQLSFAAGAASALPSPAAELAALESEVLAAYRRLDSPDQHSSFIRVNSLLKVAQDLAHEGRRNGAWLQVFEARRALLAILIPTPENRTAAMLQSESEAWRKRLAGTANDQSIGWLYWQMAEAAMVSDDLKQANAILHHVLPRYFQLLLRKKR